MVNTILSNTPELDPLLVLLVGDTVTLELMTVTLLVSITDDVTGTITVEDNTGGGRRVSFISIT